MKIERPARSIPAHLGAHLAGGHHIPGIIMLDPSVNWMRIATEIELLISCLEQWELRDKIHYLPL
jgi:hypothetical protein